MTSATKPANTARPSTYSTKGAATRNALLHAAREIIARDGYANAKISDIAALAGKSVGVFYTYFVDKSELFTALVGDFYLQVTELAPPKGEFEHHTAAAVKATVAAFWVAYRRNHAELAGLIEVAYSDPKLLAVWRKIRAEGQRRLAFRIRRQQEAGRCSGVDPELTASALLGLLEFACFNWQSRQIDFPGRDVSDDRAIDTLYRIIAQSLELHDDGQAPESASRAPARKARATRA